MSYVFLLIYTVIRPRVPQIIAITPMPSEAVCNAIVKKAYRVNGLMLLDGDYHGYECFVVDASSSTMQHKEK